MTAHQWDLLTPDARRQSIEGLIAEAEQMRTVARHESALRQAAEEQLRRDRREMLAMHAALTQARPIVAAALAWRDAPKGGLASADADHERRADRALFAAVDAYRVLQVQGEPIESLLTREMFTAEALEIADTVKARTTGPHPYSGSRRKDHAGAKCIRCGFGPVHANHKMTALDEEVQGEPETAAVSAHCNGCGTSHHPNVIGVACRRGYGDPEPMLVFTEEQMREWDRKRPMSDPIRARLDDPAGPGYATVCDALRAVLDYIDLGVFEADIDGVRRVIAEHLEVTSCEDLCQTECQGPCGVTDADG